MEKDELMNEPVVNETPAGEKTQEGKEIPQPILPDADYVAEAEKDDPEELAQSRRKLMVLLRAKCGSVGNDVLTFQIQPMVYSMTLKDCNNLYDLVKKKGVAGLLGAFNKHNKMVKKQGN